MERGEDVNYNPSIWDPDLSFGRQQYLYAILKANREPMKIVDLAKRISAISKEPQWILEIIHCKNFHNSTYRRTITRDIQAINNSDKFDGIIVHSTNGVHLATKVDAEIYIDSECAEAIRKLNAARKMAKKMGLDGQIDFTGKIKDFYERN